MRTNKEFIEILNNRLAQGFVDYVRHRIRTGNAGLKDISSATKKISGQHNPLSHTGDLLEHLEAKGEVAEFSNASVPDSNLTYAQLALILQSGFRVPTTGAKGEKVRNWLHYNGIHLKKSTKYLVSPPSPFMDKLLNEYMNSNEYDNILSNMFEGQA